MNSVLNSSLLLLSLAVAIVWCLKRSHLPSLLGYLAVGMLVGPYGLALVPEHDVIALLAEIGVAFLLFMIGLEFSVQHLLTLRKAVFGLGSLQILICSLTGGILVWALGLSWQVAIIMGGILSLSSTAIVARQLSEQFELQSPHGQLSIAILLFQDLAVVPLLVAIPILASDTPDGILLSLTIATGKAVCAFIAMYVVGHFMLRRFFHLIASRKSIELFTLATLLVALAAAWLTHLMGLSLALGAFLAGIMLGETEYRQQIELDIRPFQDILMGVFFISVGMQFNWAILHEKTLWIFLMTSGLILGKGAVIAMLTRVFYDTATAIRTGIILGQGSEFGFAILVVALQNELLLVRDSQPIIASLILSMMIAPFLIRYNQQIMELLFPKIQNPPAGELDKSLSETCQNMGNHVVICGFGQIGQNLALFLRSREIPHVALDLDHSLVKQAWEAGEKVFYGDSANHTLMSQLGLQRAQAVVITFDDARIAERIINTVKTIRDTIPVIVRSHDDKHMRKLLAAGATEVVPESFEASMRLAKHVLQYMGMNPEKAMLSVEGARNNEYQRLRGVFHGKNNNTIRSATMFQLNTVIVIPGSFAEGKRLDELKLKDLNVSITSLRKGTVKMDYPDKEQILEQGNALVLQGTINNLQTARGYMMTGKK